MFVEGISPGGNVNPYAEPKVAKRELGKDEFLKLLVTQLKFQDPLNPMSNEDFIAQTAQFTSLETLGKINENIISSNKSFEQMNGVFATSMLGKEVKVNIGRISLSEGKAAAIEFDIPEGDSAIVSIYDGNSNILVRRKLVDNVSGKYVYKWDGLDEKGNLAKDGAYSVKVQASNPSGKNTKLSYSVTEKVLGVRPDKGVLILSNDIEVPISSILKIVEAEAKS